MSLESQDRPVGRRPAARRGLRPRRGGRPVWAAMFAMLAVAAAALPANAENAWVRDEVRLNLRTGPGTEFRILDSIQTGDSVTVLARRDGWTRVRLRDAREGWIPEGYLADAPPARIQLERLTATEGESREEAERLRGELESLRETHAKVATTHAELTTRVDALERENFELRAGARWPEWIAGAGILSCGMIVGAILQSWGASRRSKPRIRL